MPTTTHVESSTIVTKEQTSNRTVGSDRTNVKEFVTLLQEKDKTIEEKNQLLFALQNQIGQMESRLQQMIALPDYTAEKTTLEQSITTLEQQKTILEDQVRREKLRNAVYMGLVMIAALVVAVIMFL
jgi:septal ring factor EnvC (AmiA/AmiB activator)